MDENAVIVSQEVSTVFEDIEKKVVVSNVKAKECKELNILKEKCCSKNVKVSVTSFQAINKLVERKVLTESQTISTLVSLLPSVIHYNPLISTIGNLLLSDLKNQLQKNKTYQSPYNGGEIQHPFVMVLKFNGNESWFEIYSFIQDLLQEHDNIKLKHKISLLRPIFHHVFWDSKWRGSQFQARLFNLLLLKVNEKDLLILSLEVISCQDIDIYHCLFLQDIFIHLLNNGGSNSRLIVSALTPMLAEVIKWLILNGYNPICWLHLLSSSIETDDAALSVVLYILADIITETPSVYINSVVNICKTIICSASCNVYTAHKFMAVALNWFINPSSLAYPVCKTLEEIVLFLHESAHDCNDQTFRLLNNEYFQIYGSNNNNIKFAVDLITLSNSWSNKLELIEWLTNLKQSAMPKMQLKLHSFIYSVILLENDKSIISLCIEILFQVLNNYSSISFSILWVLFYKLARETIPCMQKTYLLALPKLAVVKENVPLIIKVIESLKGGQSKIIEPIIIQLFLKLWKLDNRTYSYLHRVLYESSGENMRWEINTSKAIALREICRLAPHLHGKSLISILSRVLNESADLVDGLPLAITIEAVIELCKAYVIDVFGIWYAIQPKLSIDRRPNVLKALCKFFGEIPKLNSSEQKYLRLIDEVVPMLWNYTLCNDVEVVKRAFQALSKYEIENLDSRLLPESYRLDLEQLEEPNQHSKNVKSVSPLSSVPAECWLLFLEKINESYLNEGGALLISMIERELNSLPRGLFHLPPEKCEPTKYSYLPQNSICRVFVNSLRKNSNVENFPNYLKEIIRILSYEYSKCLPPLDWHFMSPFLDMDSEYLHCTLALLAKQGAVSVSARSMLGSYLSEVKWNNEKLDTIVFLYGKIHHLCTAVPLNVLQNFCLATMTLCIQTSLKTKINHFEIILENLEKALKSDQLNSDYKIMFAKQLENILEMIPPEHKLMKNYASCVMNLPLKLVGNTALTDYRAEVKSDCLHRAIIIRSTFALGSNVKNPLNHVSALIGAVEMVPEKQSFFLFNISSLMRSLRSANHSTWLQELIQKIQTSITISNRNKESVFLIDLFVTAVIVLTGYDCLFTNLEEVSQNTQKKLYIFPQSFGELCNFPELSASFPKVWLQRLLKWKHLPHIYVQAFVKSMMIFNNPGECIQAEFFNIAFRNIEWDYAGKLFT